MRERPIYNWKKKKGTIFFFCYNEFRVIIYNQMLYELRDYNNLWPRVNSRKRRRKQKKLTRKIIPDYDNDTN